MPQELNFALPASLPAEKTFEIRLQPVNSQSFTAGNVIQFDIPSNKRGQYLDTTTNDNSCGSSRNRLFISARVWI